MTYNSCESFFVNQINGLMEYCRLDWVRGRVLFRCDLLAQCSSLPYRPLSLTGWRRIANPLRMRMVDSVLLVTEGGLSSAFFCDYYWGVV